MVLKTGWLINDCLTCIPGTKTFWHNLLEWFPNLVDKTNGYTSYNILADTIESDINSTSSPPDYIIRNGSYFRKINTDIKQITLIQDARPDLMCSQIEVINNSTVVVFNSNYIFNKYKNDIPSHVHVKICPLGTDFDLFSPSTKMHPDVLPNSILFIGDSSNYPKGFNIMMDIFRSMTNQNFCFIMKDQFNLHNIEPENRARIKIFNKVNTSVVQKIINSCVLLVCTSYEETQHLSGIECAACNKPIVAREVGIYYDNKDDLRWGCIADDSCFVEKINYVLENIDTYRPRECFIDKYSNDTCKQNWMNMIDDINNM